MVTKRLGFGTLDGTVSDFEKFKYTKQNWKGVKVQSQEFTIKLNVLPQFSVWSYTRLDFITVYIIKKVNKLLYTN